MKIEYRKPGDWCWTQHDSKSLVEDAAIGLVQHGWRYRVLFEPGEYTLDELLQVQAARKAKAEYERAIQAYQAQPLPSPVEFPTGTTPLAVLLSRYLSRYVGINYRDTKKFERVLLTRVSDDFLTVYVSDSSTSVSFPLRHVLSVVEADTAVSVGTFFREDFCVVIEVFHVVVYSGAIGISVPL